MDRSKPIRLASGDGHRGRRRGRAASDCCPAWLAPVRASWTGGAIAIFALLLVWRLAQRSRFRKPSTRSELLTIPNTLGLSLACKLRNNKVLVTLSRWIFQRAVPIAFAFAVIVLGLFLINRILFDVASAAGAFCTETPKEQRARLPIARLGRRGLQQVQAVGPQGSNWRRATVIASRSRRPATGSMGQSVAT